MASCTSIGLPSQVSSPSPALVHRASVPQTLQRYLLPSWLATFRPPANGVVYCFSSIGWPQHVIVPLPPLVIIISAPHLVQRYLLPTWFAISYHLCFRVSQYIICQKYFYCQSWHPLVLLEVGWQVITSPHSRPPRSYLFPPGRPRLIYGLARSFN